MSSDEVIGVEENHREQYRAENSLRQRYHKLKGEAKALETKLKNVTHAHDALHKQMFHENQRQCRIAQLLGFHDFDAMEAKVTTRNLQTLDGQEHVLRFQDQASGQVDKEEEMEQLLEDAQDEALRLRKGRDFARGEAERYATEVHTLREELQRCREEVLIWKNELKTKLPEMQALIKEHKEPITNSSQPDEVEKENVPHQRTDRTPNPLRDIVNSPSLSENNSALPGSRNDAQFYKEQYDLMEGRYNELVESKKKLSRRYFEDLKKWKEFKEWLVKDRPRDGVKRRVLRRRKATEDVGLQANPPASKDEDVTAYVATVKNNPGEAAKTSACDFPLVEQLSPSPPLAIARQTTPSYQESLTQTCSLPFSSSASAPVALPSSIRKVSANVSPSVSQKGMKQPSTPPSSAMVVNIYSKDDPQCLANAVESSPSRIIQKQDSDGLSCSSKGRVRITPGKHFESEQCHDPEADSSIKTRPSNGEHAQTEPPASQRIATSPFNYVGNTRSFAVESNARRTGTVLVMETPPHKNQSVRHQLSPPDPRDTPRPHTPTKPVRKNKRNIKEILDASGDPDQEADSDPFEDDRPGSSTRSTKPGKQSHAAYMARYMPYKGRGRYSAAKEVTVNSAFEVDPTRNSGVNFQFDAAVLDKAERKTLNAGDCECCRDYYDAVGVLPPRLQQPKWKSPSQEKQPHEPCRHQMKDNSALLLSTPSRRARDVAFHKHEISRHRHHWAPPDTPPKYWHIGFPDTQEVESINRQANDMHARKLQCIEAEADSKDGRYRRRE